MWLENQGYSPELQKRYRKSGWLTSIGRGAMIRSGDHVGFLGALYALQNQAGFSIHPGAKSALAMQGKSHYLEMRQSTVILFGDPGERLPLWFEVHQWDRSIDYHATSFLPSDMGLTELQTTHFSIRISTPARAMMECLYLTPREVDFAECFLFMEALNNLVPAQVKILLEACTSVKVKRLFLYLAEKAGHKWLSYVDLSKVDLGKGKRSFARGGVYIPKFQITVPRELESEDQSDV